MEWTEILHMLPNFALALLALIIILAVWAVWRTIAPAAPGLSLGFYEVVGRQYGSRVIRRIRGTLVDATDFWLARVETQFFKLLREDVERVMTKQSNPDPKLKELLEILDRENVRLTEYIRILVTREKLFTKHVLIQYGHVDRPLNAYAAYDPQSKFSLGFGFLTQGVITGTIHSIPAPYTVEKLGKVHPHLFIPDALSNENENFKEPPEYLAKLALYAPAYVELSQQLKAKDEMVKEAKRERQKADKQLAAHATLLDSLITAVQGFTTKLKPEEAIIGRKGFSLMDFITIAFPTIIGYFVAEQFGFSPLAGVIVGMLLGAFIVFRRTSM